MLFFVKKGIEGIEGKKGIEGIEGIDGIEGILSFFFLISACLLFISVFAFCSAIFLFLLNRVRIPKTYFFGRRDTACPFEGRFTRKKGYKEGTLTASCPLSLRRNTCPNFGIRFPCLIREFSGKGIRRVPFFLDLRARKKGTLTASCPLSLRRDTCPNFGLPLVGTSIPSNLFFFYAQEKIKYCVPFLSQHPCLFW